MKNFTLLLLALAAGSVTANAQEKKYPEQMPMRPEMTEYWTPQPKHVVPGNRATQSAPSDAIVLFDGKDLSKWENTLLHIEWCVPKDIEGTSQARGNSGVYMQGKYELQVLDNYENETYVDGMVGSIYKQYPPLVNPDRKPGEWNAYDIIYTAPVFKADGSYMYRPRITVLLNGVLVQNNVEILGTTEYIGLPRCVQHGDGPILLQAHGDKSKPISYRNIWIRPL